MTTEQNNQETSDESTNDTGEGQAQVAEEGSEIAELAELKKQLEERDATIGSLKRENKDLKKPKETVETPQKTDQQSDEPDYARLAFLNSQQVNHPDDQKVVLEEATRLKLPLTDVLQMEHIKAKLANSRDTRASQEGMPDGKGRTGGPKKGDVEYYLANPDQVPDDLELHNKVIEARMNKIENDGKFAKVPFVG